MVVADYQNNAKRIKCTVFYLLSIWYSVKHFRTFKKKIEFNLPNLIVALSQSEDVYKHRNVDGIYTLNGINMMK